MEWINAKKTLPKLEWGGFSVWVLVSSRFGSMEVSRYDFENSRWITSMNRGVSFWMPLPDPPKP